MATTRIADFITIASHLTLIQEADILSKSRMQRLVRVRFAICYVARSVMINGSPKFTLGEIARRIGLQDHSTVHHAVTRAEELCKRDPKFAKLVADIIDIAETSRPFINMRAKPVRTPIELPPRQRRPVVDRSMAGECNAVRFHLGVEKGSKALAEALGVA